MTKEQLKPFLEKVRGNTTLQEKLKAAADTDAVVATAEEAGFSISAEDLQKAQPELSGKELERMAGGDAGGDVGSLWSYFCQSHCQNVCN
ncbi:nif11-like leader peptide domain protein [Synechococcus sp. BIOS-U3-1]|uniref:Nif11-like leader peptide family natural product precursor n=1 Tax=Synechococcus sp. BIOS-U3-1 TaxID=1400865 RepID=UPI0016471534|nr:Nif11-like leader peptide family natural product precursor [Synechococcus sp. BIOS-U3-1]QNI59488.1 nif11-like leader peptide domain protein [Synechococcus sp. BIOS-U3-1]|tara:strand:- start:64 stop:333 length:270 start_codon:yes stop_codon:yes gene_type:complete